MFRLLAGLFLSQILAVAATAHEFWIEPRKMFIAKDAPLRPVLMIGAHPDGQRYAFQPQAYAQAI